MFILFFFVPGAFAGADAVTILKHRNETVIVTGSDKLPADRKNSFFLELKLSGNGKISFKSEGSGSSLDFSIGEKPESICLYSGLTGGLPEELIITGSDYDIYSALLKQPSGELSPLTADIGHIIFSDFNYSRSPEWEVYRWNLLPEVLIFDTADYGIQANLFKRLAFFVEKPGYVGRLITNAQLEGKHGWNAHDYQPVDLAAFFTKAAEENFPLNREEEILREILIDENIIIKDAGGGYTGGFGAVLSVSRESPANWRYRFLTHECLHGLFFTDEAFRTGCQQVFKSLQPEEIEFWKRLLDYRGYDVENFFLLSNEFMAYSLQQPAEEINDYFKTFLYERMIAARPYEAPFVEKFEKEHPDSFTKSLAGLEAVLYKSTGRRAGHLSNLIPSGLSPSFFDLFPLR